MKNIIYLHNPVELTSSICNCHAHASLLIVLSIIHKTNKGVPESRSICYTESMTIAEANKEKKNLI